MAIAICPTLMACESPSITEVRRGAVILTRARSLSGSSPTRLATNFSPSSNCTAIFSALWTTWLLVRMNPSGVKTKPEPLPCASRPRRPDWRIWPVRRARWGTQSHTAAQCEPGESAPARQYSLGGAYRADEIMDSQANHRAGLVRGILVCSPAGARHASPLQTHGKPKPAITSRLDQEAP